MSENSTNNTELLSNLILTSSKRVFLKESSVSFSSEPQVEQKEIIEYGGRMRISGLEKFNDACFISATQFYKTEEDLSEKSAIGAMVIYIKGDVADKVFRSFGVKKFDEVDQDSMLEISSEISKKFTTHFLKELQTSGQGSFISSEPIGYVSNALEGVSFSYDETKYCEASFHLFKEKAVVIDVTFALSA
jgi:hypothetical protein